MKKPNITKDQRAQSSEFAKSYKEVRLVANRLYDGTSAYKIEEYESYRDRVQETHETRKNRKVKHVAINHRKLMIITGVVFAVAVAFLYANVVLIQTATRHDKLVNDIQDTFGVELQTVDFVNYKTIGEMAEYLDTNC